MRRLQPRALLALVLGVVAGTQLSCGVNDYCLNCGTNGDAGRDGNGIGDGGGDGGDGGGSACVPTGPEICDGIDNDCNGLIDDGVLPGVGDACANQMGVCAGGVQQCTPSTQGDPTTDRLTCTKTPSPEVCDNKDNDCNGLVDEGDPGGGGKCGTSVGVCVAGTNHCVGGSIQCVGFQDHTMDPELCNGLDDNCNGEIDEGLTNMGACGTKTCVGGTNAGTICQTSATCTGGTCMSGVGACTIGTLECRGGTAQCCGTGMGPCPPAPTPSIELCDGIDNDCDGKIDEGFDFTSDINHCGDCVTVCAPASMTCINSPNASATCTGDADCPGGSCVANSVPTCSVGMNGPTCGFTCKAGFHDLDGNPANGCEYGVCFTSGVEVCDGIDNDCDGVIDDNLGTPPSICATKGACATGTTITCNGAGGWECNYPADVSTDGMGNIIPETLCDGIDNDCNGRVDDNQPDIGDACNNGHQGVCGVTGTFICDVTNLNGPAVCDAGTSACSGLANNAACTVTNAGGTSVAGHCNAANGSCIPTPGVESCNGLDDDCDGIIDNNPTDPGDFPGGGIEWINIGAGHQMMKYEASKPDASATDGGNLITSNCGAASTITATGANEAVSPMTTAAITTTTANGLTAGRVVVISGVTNNGYNGTYKVLSIVSPTVFTITLPVTGLLQSGTGTVTPVCPTCSKQGVLPWTNVTYPKALAACKAVGGSLCSDQQWHRACSVINPTTYPIAVPSGGFNITIEAEDYYAVSLGTDTTHSWIEDYTPGFSGMSDMIANPDSGTSNDPGTVAVTASPRLDYQFNFAAAGNYRVCLYAFGPSGSSDSAWVAINPTPPGAAASLIKLANGTDSAWVWAGPTANISVAAGINYLSVYMREDGERIDQVYLTTANACPATTTLNSRGNTWAYQNTPNTYQPMVCNGQDYDVTQDAMLPTGTASAQCFANDGALTGGTANDHAFDMSGNVKEWAFAHQPGQNPIRGGAADNTGTGISCPLNFTLGDDTFFFPNVGFRCCR